MRVFSIGTSGQRLVFAPSVLEHFNKHRQVRWWRREAGGQLFARIELPDIRIETATGPRVLDRRSRNSYWPDRDTEHLEISTHHALGLHFVGDWHTHPEARPTPSLRDVATMQDIVDRSSYVLNGLILAIVGTLPDALSVSLFDRATRSVSRLPACADARPIAGTPGDPFLS